MLLRVNMQLLYSVVGSTYIFLSALVSSFALALRSDLLRLSRRNDSRSDFFRDFLLDIGVSDVPVKSMIEKMDSVTKNFPI